MRKFLLPFFLVTFLLSSSLANAAENDDLLSRPFELTLEEKTETVTLSQLGVRIVEEREQAYRAQNFLASVPLLGFLFKEESPDWTWSPSRSEDLIRKIFDADRAKNASFQLENGTVVVKSEVPGIEFDAQTTLEEITEDFEDLTSYTIESEKPEVITDEELEALLPQVQSFLNPGFKIYALEIPYTFPAQLKDLSVLQKDGHVELAFNEPFQNYMLSTLGTQLNQAASDLVIVSANLDKVAVAKTEGRVRDGREVLRETTLTQIAESVNAGANFATATVETVEGKIVNKTGLPELDGLVEIAEGKSNFATSPAGRDYNVRKGLNEKFHGVVVPQGTEFSYNALLGPVTYSAGWKPSLAIFGTQLSQVPGGGLCQVSTTIYRAALDAGTNITAQRNHSLYVHYYVAYGDGLDATIYPGSQDLRFMNDTPGPILMEAYDEGYDAVVKFYGKSDGRETTLAGPYTASNQPDYSKTEFRTLSRFEILWEYWVTKPDGSKEREWLVSKYKSSVKQY